MADGDPIETELKFLIDPGAVKRLRAHSPFGAAPRIRSLRSVYFDTDDHALAAAGFSLRVRTGEGGPVQTVKSLGAAQGVARGEWESPLTAARPDPAALTRTPALTALGGGTQVLRPVFTTTVRRTAWLWRHGADAVEISLDEGQVRAGGRRARLLEVELELKSGSPAALFGLAARLRVEAPLRVSFESKAEQGYRLARGEERDCAGAVAAGVAPGITAAEAFRRIARASLAQVTANAEILRGVRPPEAVHQMRVGLRRLRAAVTAFAPLVEGPERAVVSADLAWLAGELDQARDQDVFEKSTFRPAAERAQDLQPGAAEAYDALGLRLREIREAAYGRALAAIHSTHAEGLVLDALRWVEIGDWTAADGPGRRKARDQDVRDFAIRSLDDLMNSVRKRARRLKSLAPRDRHRLRIKAKKLRYAAEFLAPAFDRASEARRLLSRLEAMQEALGELNDIAVARDKALLDAGREPDLAYAAGRAVGWRERGEAELMDAAAKAARKLRDSELFWRA